jgi:glycosyltransferase involved in cell wall biosynthesis
MPAVSVVVPTFNRAELLRPLAEALNAQDGVGDFEVLFVDDGSTDATSATLEEVLTSAKVPMRVLRTTSSNGGPAAARNVGWRAARAPLVAFTDDDCIPQFGWLAGLADAFDGANIVQGLTEVDPRQADGSGPFARLIVITDFSWKFETCNVAYSRELLERLGGFDEGFPLPFGEDIDLGWRAMALGARTTWKPEAVVLHRVEKSGSRVRDWVNWIRYARRCEFAGLTVQKHPGLRAHLYGRCFYKPYHLHTLLALAGLLLARRAPRSGALLALPWVYYRTSVDPRRAPRKWLWAVLPMGFVVDATEVLSTIRGAIRYRTLIL